VRRAAGGRAGGGRGQGAGGSMEYLC
jgi:hypothetical protein